MKRYTSRAYIAVTTFYPSDQLFSIPYGEGCFRAFSSVPDFALPSFYNEKAHKIKPVHMYPFVPLMPDFKENLIRHEELIWVNQVDDARIVIIWMKLTELI